MVTRVVDTLIVFRILKMLTTPFEDTKAYELGFIDKDGQRLKYKPDPKNPNNKIENKPTTNSEKESYTYLHRLVFNLKRIIQKVPFGKSKFASYAAALALLKEFAELTDEQTDMLSEEMVKQFGITETNDEKLVLGETYNLIRDFEQTDLLFKSKSKCEIVSEHSKYFGYTVYNARINGHPALVTSDEIF